MPTAVARPWPSGPAVVSTPRAWPYSGWPAVLEPSWRKRLISLDRHVRIAGQIEQRIEQHRAVAGRQHEAVAVGPARVGGIEFEELREQHRRDVGHAHRHARMAGLGFLDRVHRQEADGVGHRRVRDGGSLNNRVHVREPLRESQARTARRRRSTSFRIIGVRMSCIAMSSLPPGMTIELARLMKLLWIIDRR